MTFLIQRLLPSCAIGLLVCMPMVAQEASSDEAKQTQPKEENKPRKLVVTPAAETEFSYDVRLFPDASKRQKGNAATVLLRYAWELRNQYWDGIGEARLKGYASLPLNEFKRDQHAQVVRWETLERAANCSDVDWNRDIYNNDRLEEVLLPDVQQCRHIIYALATLIRADIAEGKLDSAINKLQVGFSLVRQMQDSPFYVVKLVGRANANVLLDQVEDLIEQPDCPNLYWALQQLPSPFIDAAECVDFENAVFSDLRDLDRKRTPKQWKELGEQIKFAFGPGTLGQSKEKDEAYQDQIRRGREWLVKAEHFTQSQVEKMGDDEIAIRWFGINYTKWTDQYNRWMSLPPSVANSRLTQIEKQIDKEAKETQGVGLKVIAFRKMHGSLWAVEQRIAALKTVEAIRAKAVMLERGRSVDNSILDNDSDSPTPVAIDPMTGKPFLVEIRDGLVTIKGGGLQTEAPIHFHLELRKQ